MVEEYGGDIIKFAGDAIICFWPFEKEQVKSQQVSTECALVMISKLNLKIENIMTDPKMDDIMSCVTLHVGLGIGDGTITILFSYNRASLVTSSLPTASLF